MIDFLLYLALAYLLLNFVVLLLNKSEVRPLLPAEQAIDSAFEPRVSVCIPARNEENVIERAVRSCINQQYGPLEILVLDDNSGDRTGAVLGKLRKEFPELLTIIEGRAKPPDWLGKSWACHQLSRKARGEVLFFMDADAWLAPQAVRRTVASMHHYKVGFLTVWPIQKVSTFWERVAIPIVYYGLFTLLPARLVHRPPRWLPRRLGSRFAAACGQCMVFRRLVYKQIGGHRAVKNNIVEDVALARQIRQHGCRMRMFHGRGTVTCRMYTSAAAMWNGFRKNFLAIFNDNVPVFAGMAGVNFIVYVLPWFVFLKTILYGPETQLLLSASAVGLAVGQRLVLARWFHWKPGMAWLHWLGILWFNVLGLQVLGDYYSGTRARWKNRPTV